MSEERYLTFALGKGRLANKTMELLEKIGIQSVERILGKDEVASSNLASSSKKSADQFGSADFLSTNSNS